MEPTYEELVAAGLIEGPGYRDFPPANEDDPEAYDEMCYHDRSSMPGPDPTAAEIEAAWEATSGTTMRALAEQAIAFYVHPRDTGFDAGEIIGPISTREADRKVEELADRYGTTYDEVMAEVHRIACEDN